MNDYSLKSNIEKKTNDIKWLSCNDKNDYDKKY